MYQEQVRLAVSPTPCLSRFAHGPAATVNTIRLLDEDKPPTVLENLVRALALVATYLGLLKKQVEHSGGIDLVARLRAARRRGRAA